jgi:hypothetical protein
MKRVGDLGRTAQAMTALAVVMSGCASLFGIDDPTPCPNGVCPVDGSPTFPVIDATVADGATGGGSDAPLDQAPPEQEASADGGAVEGGAVDAAREAEPPGVLCGGPALRCTGTTPDCCGTYDGGASPSYTCKPSTTSCPSSGYLITCADNADCKMAPTGNACCQYSSGLKCVPPTTTNCPAWVCDPGVDGGCPAGQSCTAPLQILGQPSPYFACK